MDNALITRPGRHLTGSKPILHSFNDDADGLQESSEWRREVIPVHAVHRILDSKPELGVTFNPDPPLEKQRIRVRPAGGQQDEIKTVTTDADIFFQAAVNWVEAVAPNLDKPVHIQISHFDANPSALQEFQFTMLYRLAKRLVQDKGKNRHLGRVRYGPARYACKLPGNGVDEFRNLNHGLVSGREQLIVLTPIYTVLIPVNVAANSITRMERPVPAWKPLWNSSALPETCLR